MMVVFLLENIGAKIIRQLSEFCAPIICILLYLLCAGDLHLLCSVQAYQWPGRRQATTVICVALFVWDSYRCLKLSKIENTKKFCFVSVRIAY